MLYTKWTKGNMSKTLRQVQGEGGRAAPKIPTLEIPSCSAPPHATTFFDPQQLPSSAAGKEHAAIVSSHVSCESRCCCCGQNTSFFLPPPRTLLRLVSGFFCHRKKLLWFLHFSVSYKPALLPTENINRGPSVATWKDVK